MEEALYPLDHKAKAFWAAYEKVKDFYRRGEKDACRELCLELLQQVYLRKYGSSWTGAKVSSLISTIAPALRCALYHQLTCCSPFEQIEYWLDQSNQLLEELDKITKTDSTIRLRTQNQTLRNNLQKIREKIAKDGEEGKDPVPKEGREQSAAASRTAAQLPDLAFRPSTTAFASAPGSAFVTDEMMKQYPTPAQSSRPSSPHKDQD